MQRGRYSNREIAGNTRAAKMHLCLARVHVVPLQAAGHQQSQTAMARLCSLQCTQAAGGYSCCSQENSDAAVAARKRSPMSAPSPRRNSRFQRLEACPGVSSRFGRKIATSWHNCRCELLDVGSKRMFSLLLSLA